MGPLGGLPDGMRPHQALDGLDKSASEVAQVPMQFTIELAWGEVAGIEEAFERREIDEARGHE